MNDSSHKLSSLSLFFPAYNEAGNIAEAIKQALAILPTVAEKYEIIVVNDGSEDATFQIAKRISLKHPKVRVVTQSNLGYGGAVKRGFVEAQYEWIFYTDSDLQFDIKEIKKMIPLTIENDMVLGYRLERIEGIKRAMLAKALKLWANFWFALPRDIRDIDCAFKLIHRNVITSISPLFANGAMISTELIIKAIRNDFSYEQVGVSHFRRFSGQASGDKPSVVMKALTDSIILKFALMKESFVRKYYSLSFNAHKTT